MWATGQYLSYAPTHSLVDWEVTLAVEGRHVTQGRAVGRVEGREILTVNAALGEDELPVSGIWVDPPEVAASRGMPSPPAARPCSGTPSSTGSRCAWPRDDRSTKCTENRAAPTRPSGPESRVTSHPRPPRWPFSVTTFPGACRSALGLRTMGRSLDNTLRLVQLKPTEWVLCDIRMHAADRWLCPGRGLLVVAGRRSPGHGQPIDGGSALARRRRPRSVKPHKAVV